MKITLIFPRTDPRRGTKIKNHMIPPYGLQLLAALTPPRHEVVLLDQFLQPIDTNLDADLIGISVWTGSAGNAYQLADAFRVRGIPVVLGGPHVAVLPEEARKHADSVVVGEAEAVWAQLLGDFEAGQMAPVYEADPLPLSMTPPARWDIFQQGDYVLRSAVSTSRGCRFRCEFCYESSRPNSTYRRKPLDQVLTEIDSRPGPVIAFLDNDLLSDKKYARSLLEALIPRRKAWMAMTTIRFADDPDMVALAAAAGCKTLFVGFESVSTESLLEVGKRQNRVDIYARNIRRLHDHGIMVNGSFVFGFDHDGPEVFDNTVQFGIDNLLETATFTILTPYPNTGLYKKLQVQGRIFDYNWAHYDTTRVVFEPAMMTIDELEAGLTYAYRKFYSMGSIFSRAFRPGSGALKRLVLNLAYKRIEPVWKTLDLGLSARWIRPVTYWYMSAMSHRLPVARESVQPQLVIE
ncbi:MAG: B12-binding domain-containing radical SAM protein [Anaerolineae bacterium]|nr:B12-binding domain-containing radical SAM protein [Anaerolineae bacterium]